MQFLSPEWIQALDRVARHHDGLARLAASDDLIIEVRVTDTSTGDTRYRIALVDGGVSVRPADGEGDRPRSTPTVPLAGASPTVSLTMDLDTAAGIARHQEAPQLAFLEGRLRLGGDTSALLAHHRVLSDLGDVFAEVRASTRW